MDKNLIRKVILDNINPILGICDLDYVRGPFMDMVHLIIEKDKFMLRSHQLKYTSSTKDNHKKSYQMKENNQINFLKLSSTKEYEESF